MMFVAAIEHAARTFVKALAERCCGPAGYEDSDYYAVPGPNIHGYRLDYPESPLVEREAEQEVAEPRDVDGDLWRAAAGMFRKMDSANCGYCGQPTRGVHLSTCPRAKTPSSTTPPASQPPVDDASWPADSDIPPSPAGQPPTPAELSLPKYGMTCVACDGNIETCGCFDDDDAAPTVPAEVSARTPTPAPSAGLQTPGSFAAVAVREVLAGVVSCGRGHICIEDARTDDWSADDWYDWREHVSAEVRRRIDAATKSQARQHIETGHDMGVSIACETFPQYRGGRS